jgi:ribonuclease HII
MLAKEISGGAAWSVDFAEVSEIDTINIYWAGLLTMRRAVEGLSRSPQHVLVDARRIKDLPIPQQPIVKGDCKSLTIAAASILAKTARDALMHRLDASIPLRLCEAQGLPLWKSTLPLGGLSFTDHRRSFGPSATSSACLTSRHGPNPREFAQRSRKIEAGHYEVGRDEGRTSRSR